MQIENNKVNSLKVLAKSSATAESVFTALALRDRMRHVTDLGRFRVQLVKEAGNIVEDHYMSTFKQLQSLGFGSIVYGRKGKADKFKWNYNLKEIGLAAVDSAKIEAFIAATPEVKQVAMSTPKTKPVDIAEKVVDKGHSVTFKKGELEIVVPFESQEKLIEFIKNMG